MKMDIRRLEREPTYGWKFCGNEYDYGLFSKERPREIAKRIIEQVFPQEEIQTKSFAYIAKKYRGRQSLQDTIDVFYAI